MKKLLGIVVLCLLWCNVGFAEKINQSMQELLNNNYKITKEELIKWDRYAHKVFTLKKRKNVIVCSVKIYRSTGVSSISKCMIP
tara:strand:+ start:67 stop:318 length:252 start_codon:yes stop_codon:yes gene_type:complete